MVSFVMVWYKAVWYNGMVAHICLVWYVAVRYACTNMYGMVW